MVKLFGRKITTTTKTCYALEGGRAVKSLAAKLQGRGEKNMKTAHFNIMRGQKGEWNRSLNWFRKRKRIIKG